MRSIITVIVAVTIIVGACSSNEEETAGAVDTTALARALNDDSTDAPISSTTEGGDPNNPLAGLSELETIMYFFGIGDTAGAAACVSREASADETTVDDLLANPDGTAIMVAAIRCEPDIMQAALYRELDTSSLSASTEQIGCALSNQIQRIAEIDLADASANIFTRETPPDLLDAQVEECGLSVADARFFWEG